MSSEGKIEDLNKLLKGFGNIERVAAEFDFLPTAEEMLLKVIAKLNPNVNTDAVYEGRVVTISNIDKLEKSWRDRMPEWHNQLKQLHCEEGLYRYCELLTKIVGQLFGYSQKLGATNRVIVSAIKEGYTQRPVPIKKIKANLEVTAEKLAAVAIDWLKQLLVIQEGGPSDTSDTIGPPVKPEVKPPKPPKPKVPPPPKTPKPKVPPPPKTPKPKVPPPPKTPKPKVPPPPKTPKPKVPPPPKTPKPKVPPPPKSPEPKVPPPNSEVIPKPGELPINRGLLDFIHEKLKQLEESLKKSNAEPGTGDRGPSFVETEEPPVPQIKMGKTRILSSDYMDVFECLRNELREELREAHLRKTGIRKDEEILFRFLPNSKEILRSCCDWEYKITGMVVCLEDIPRMQTEWMFRPEWVYDLNRLSNRVGSRDRIIALRKYAVKLYTLLQEISLDETNPIMAIEDMQKHDEIVRRNPEMLADMLAMDRRQIVCIIEDVLYAAGIDQPDRPGRQFYW